MSLIPSPQDLLKKVQGGITSAFFPSSTPTIAPASPSIPSPESVLASSQSGPSFGANLFNTAKSFVSKAASAVGSFVGSNAKNVADAATGKLAATPEDYLQGVKTTFSGLESGIVGLAKGFNEGVVRIGKSAAEATLGPDATKAIGDLGIGNATVRKFAQDITGQKSTPTYQEIYSMAHDYAVNNNATPDQAKLFGGVAVIGSLFADNPIVGPEKEAAKGLFELTDQAVKDLVKADSDEAVKTILKAENPGLNETQLEALGPVFRNADSETAVKNAADQVRKIQEIRTTPAPAKAAEDIPAPEDVSAASERALTGGQEPSLPYYRSIEGDAGQATRFEPVEGQPVKIADGVDTFIHQPEHGAYEVLEANTGRLLGHAAATPEEAIASAREAVAGKTPEEISQAIAAHPESPRAARARSQAAQEALGAPQPYNQNLVRRISEEDLPGPIADMLRGEFPSLSDQALGPIAKRLSTLHRTGDIQGILQVVRNLERDISAARGGVRATRPPISITAETVGDSVAKVHARQELGDLPASIGELLTSAERGRYLDNVQRTIKDPETAVLAQQEYDAIWEHADQRIIDRYEELRLQRDLGRDALSTHPGKELLGLYKGTFKSPDDVQLDELINQVKKVRGSKTGLGVDTRIDEITGRTGGDIQDAQKELDNYRAMRDQVLEIEAEMRELKPKVRAARMLQTMIEDVPVISRPQAGEINALATPERVRGYKDISGFMGQVRDVYRNFEAVFGDSYPDVKRVILDPFDKSKGEMVKLLDSIGNDLEENVIKKYGFNRGSKESAAIQRYGDSSLQAGERMSREDLVNAFGREKADHIVEADAYFRRKYDQFIEKVNAVRAEIFPNDPSKLIPKRKDYYRHFTELGDGFRAIVDIFETPAGIDPQLAGLSEWTKPKSKFLSFAQERLGKSSTIDAIGGFLDYAPSYAYALHVDPHIGKFRYLRRQLSETAPRPGVKELVPAADQAAAAAGAQDLVKQNGINNFLEYLDDFANNLAGKTNPLDRWFQKVMPGGRKTFRAINWINSRVKANTILGNLSSSVAQIFNVPQGIASAKLYSIPGIQRTLGDFLAKIQNKSLRTAIDESAFISERYREDLSARFKVDWVAHPIQRTTEQGKEFGAWITGVLDEVGTKFIWQSHYAKAIGEGIADPVKYADDTTRALVAGRGVGEVPLIHQSKIAQLIIPFQLEVGNLWYVMGGFVKRKDFGAIATLLVANYLMNRAAESVRGSPVVFDPIESMIDGATQAHNEMDDSGNAGRAALKFLGRNAGEILSNLPLGQTIAEAVSDDWVKNTLGIQGGKQELFGNANPGRFGAGLLAFNSLSDPLARLALPFGGLQAERTINGIKAMLEGGVKDTKGQVSYTITPTISNVIKAVLFGQNATSDAQAYFATRDDLFNRTYRQQEGRTDLQMEAETKWAEIKKLSPEEGKAALKTLAVANPDLAQAVVDVGVEEKQGLNGTERLIKTLGVDNGERADFIAQQLDTLKTDDEKKAFLKELATKKLITAQVLSQVGQLMKDSGAPPSVANGTHSTGSILDTVLTYADALGTDPLTAFNRIFTGQRIRRVDNGTIIVERMSFDASQAERKTQASSMGVDTKGMNLDHTIPLELGGSNAKSNLKLVPEATWESYTPVENYLGDILRSKKGTKKEVQDAIVKFKSGQETFEQIQTQFGVKAPAPEVKGASTEQSFGDPNSRPNRNNNPLNIKISDRTKNYPGVAGTDPVPAADGGHFLTFASREDGLNAARLLLKSDIYTGLTVDQALRKWSNKGYGGEIIPDLKNQNIDSLSDADLERVVVAMARREGSGA